MVEPLVAGAGPAPATAWSSAAILRVMEVFGVDCSLPGPYVLERAGDTSFRLYETLASAWQEEGLELAPEVRARLDAAQERAARCAGVVEALASVEGLRFQKGRQIAALYPAGWLRPANDIDVRVDGLERALEVWELLLGHGFDEFVFCTAAAAPGGVDLVFGLARWAPFDESRPGDRVEVSTFLLPGHHLFAPARRLPPGTHVTPLVETALALLDEQFQRGVRARDALDALVLLEAMTARERAQLPALARRMGLRVELRRLLGLVARTGLHDVGDLLGSGAAGSLAGALAHLRRAGGVARQASRPARLLARFAQQRQLEGGGGAADGIERLLRGRMTYRHAWAAGLYFFGVPVPDEDGGGGLAPGAFVLEDARAALGTPSGTVALTPWTEMDAEELRLPGTPAGGGR